MSAELSLAVLPLKYSWRNTLFWKLSKWMLTVLLLVVFLGSWLSNFFFQNAVDRSEQILSWYLAQDIAPQVEKLLHPNHSNWELQQLFDVMVNANPKINIYVLDRHGEIQASSGGNTGLVRSRVPVQPIEVYLKSNESQDSPTYNIDPRSEDFESIFSAAKINLGQDYGYLYITLTGDDLRRIQTVSQVGNLFTGGSSSIAISLGISGIVGVVLFYVLTRRLRRISEVLAEFREGRFSKRIELGRANDEIESLSATINGMADAIESNINELKKKDELRRELIANVSHDLRSPAALIAGLSETVIKEDTDLSPETKKRCELMLGHTKSLNKLLAELFELSRFEAKEVSVRKEHFFLDELIDELVLAYSVSSKARGISVRSNFNGDVPVVVGDAAMIGRVLTNLIDNSLRYTPQGGEVSISTSVDAEHPGWVFVAVTDTGSGIPSDKIAHVFDRFYQVKQSSGAVNGLSGLGLAIVRKIIEAHGSEIKVSSEENKFTTFRFSLPIAS